LCTLSLHPVPPAILPSLLSLAICFLIYLSALLFPYSYTGWARSHRTPRQYAPQTQFKFTQHSTQYNVKWQFGNSVQDSAYMICRSHRI
jgi:hypothetical protein